MFNLGCWKHPPGSDHNMSSTGIHLRWWQEMLFGQVHEQGTCHRVVESPVLEGTHQPEAAGNWQ